MSVVTWLRNLFSKKGGNVPPSQSYTPLPSVKQRIQRQTERKWTRRQWAKIKRKRQIEYSSRMVNYLKAK